MRKINLLFSAVTVSAAVFVAAVPARSTEPEKPLTSASAPTDTAVNVRDRSADTLTPTSQSESKSDIKLAAAIRRAITKDSRLSTTAKNIKIITDNGKVVLRGPVNTSHEKTLIAAKARAIAGAGNVSNQLDVANR